jgi:hypothetical protein
MNARQWVPAVAALLVLIALPDGGLLAQQAGGVASKVGQRLDEVGRGIRREAEVVSDSLRKRFDVVRAEINQMGLPSRVYSRVHWDRALNGSRIEVHVMRSGAVLLRGNVPDLASRDRALMLTRDTVGVTEVIDELVPLSAPEPPSTPVNTRPTRTNPGP